MAQYRATWRLENLLMVYCRIAALPKRHPDALHDEIMNFAALFEGGFTQRFINRLGQVDARMHDIRPWPSFGRLLRRLSTRRGVAALGQSLRSHGLPSSKGEGRENLLRCARPLRLRGGRRPF